MAITRWEPARELQTIQQQMNRLFGAAFDSQTANGALRRWVPPMDLFEEDAQYVLRADLPGVDDADVSVELDDGRLTISGERKSERDQRGEGYHRIERASGSFSRSLRLPDGVDPDAVTASFENGVLEVRVPKPEQHRPRRVEINTGAPAEALDSAS